MFHIVLVEPEIPPNTGNIARTCAATGSKLHLVKPLGFSIEDKHVKRAGLDYWDHVNIQIYESLEHFMQLHEMDHLYLATTKGKNKYTDVQYEKDCYIIFGKETAGLSKKLIEEYYDRTIKIPMGKETSLRSLNLSNSAAIILFEVLRQHDFPELL